MSSKNSMIFPSLIRLNRKINLLKRNGLWFFSSNPPTVLFIFNLAIFATILFAIGIYVKISDNIRISNAWQDWNMFLDSFSKLELCIIHPSNISTKIVGNKNIHNKIGRVSSFDMETHYFSIALSMHPTVDYISISHSFSHLSTAMFGKYIGLKGEESTEILNVTVIFRNEWPRNFCSHNPFQPCLDLNINACIRFIGPKSMFPHKRHTRPSKCNLNSQNLILAQHYYAGLNWQVPNIDATYYCRSRTTLRIKHNDEPNLSVPILQAYRANISQHLNRTVLFLIVIIFFVFMYAINFDHQRHIEQNEFNL